MNKAAPPTSLEVFDALHELMHLLRGQMSTASQQESALTFTEVRVLMRLGRHPGLTQKALVEHSRMDKAQMARLLSQLEAGGWLQRSLSPSDKRVRCLQLSEQGQALFLRLKARHKQAASELLGEMQPAAQAQLLQLLEQARESAQAVKAKAQAQTPIADSCESSGCSNDDNPPASGSAKR